jgi:peroxiredoxin
MTLTLLLTPLVIPILPTQAQETRLKVPSFSIRATDGRTYSPRSLSGKPTVVVFVNSGCPHNAPVVPELNELRRQLGSQANFVALVDLNLREATALRKELKLDAPLLPDPQKTLILGLGATHSLDIGVVSRDGRTLLGRWGGVSRGFIAEVQNTLKRSGAPSLNLNLSRFKPERRSGCGF